MRLHRVPSFIALLLIFAMLGGCATRVPRRRTLPQWVKNVSVPMFTNSSTQPGLEEFGTQYTVEEFLADGRLKVSAKADADMIVSVDINQYSEEPESFASDQFPSISKVSATATIKLFEPSNMTKPLVKFNSVKVSHLWVSDFRRTDYTPDVDARKALMRDLAGQVVLKTLTEYTGTQAEQKQENPLGQLQMPYNVRNLSGITVLPETHQQ